MDKEQFSNLLLEQQEKGRALLAHISTMHESRNDFGDGMAILGEVELYYVVLIFTAVKKLKPCGSHSSPIFYTIFRSIKGAGR